MDGFSLACNDGHPEAEGFSEGADDGRPDTLGEDEVEG